MDIRLFFTNIPYDCSDNELRQWIESRGIRTQSIRIIRDLVAGVSPAFGYVELDNDEILDEAISRLNGKKIRSNTVLVKAANFRPSRMA